MPDVIERVSSTDLMELSSEAGGSAMNFAAVLVLDAGPALDLATVRKAFATRIRAVPRLRQRLVRPRFGGGRPYWLDDPQSGINNHVRGLRCPDPGDERALLDVAATILTTRLPRDRPLWSATYVTGLSDGRSALILALHHVLADGIGALAVISSLVDRASAMAGDESRHRQPSHLQLRLDALRGRLRSVSHLPTGLRRLRRAARELQPRAVPKAPKTSLNQPTGQQRRLAVARADLSAVRSVAHRYHGTVNDVLLAAVSGALHRLLRERRESVDRIIVSMPIASRRATTATQLGNELGTLPVEIMATGEPWPRLIGVVERTRSRKAGAPGASVALLAPVFRALASIGLLGWYMNRQNRVTTFVSNVRGPERRLSFLGRSVVDAIPASQTTGNVTVAFTALSYAGGLVVTVVADPVSCPDVERLAEHLQDELDLLSDGRQRRVSR